MTEWADGTGDWNANWDKVSSAACRLSKFRDCHTLFPGSALTYTTPL